MNVDESNVRKRSSGVREGSDVIDRQPKVRTLGERPRLIGFAIFGFSLWGKSASFVARMFHESHAATADIGVLLGVLGCRTLRRTVQVRLRSNTLWLPSGTPILFALA
ncbi:MAG: hypothetical protein PVH75_09790, partial [Syntrophobacterales bacterium]